MFQFLLRCLLFRRSRPLLVSEVSKLGHLHGQCTGLLGKRDSISDGHPRPCTQPRTDSTEQAGSRDVASAPPREGTTVWPVLLSETKPFGPGGPRSHLGSPGSGCCVQTGSGVSGGLVSCLALRLWWVPIRATMARAPSLPCCDRIAREGHVRLSVMQMGWSPSTEEIPSASGTEDPTTLNEPDREDFSVSFFKYHHLTKQRLESYLRA